MEGVHCSHYRDECVVKKQPLAKSEDSFHIEVLSFVDKHLNALPDVIDRKSSIVLKGQFSNRPVALRKIPEHLKDRAERDLRVMDETHDLCQTANYHFHFDLSPGIVFLMPLYECNLEQYLEINEKLHRPCQNNIIFQIASGLSELHKRGIVHMDLRPTKVFVQGNKGKEKIILSNFRKSKVGGTLPKITITSPYAAPEVRGPIPLNVSHLVDAFSLGMIAFLIWSYNNNDGEAFRAFPSETFIKNQKCDYLNNAEKDFLKRLLAFEDNRSSVEKILKHPTFWGDNGIGIYMMMLDDILRNQEKEKWKPIFNFDTPPPDPDVTKAKENDSMNQSNPTSNPIGKTQIGNNGQNPTKKQSNPTSNPIGKTQIGNNGGQNPTKKQSKATSNPRGKTQIGNNVGQNPTKKQSKPTSNPRGKTQIGNNGGINPTKKPSKKSEPTSNSEAKPPIENNRGENSTGLQSNPPSENDWREVKDAKDLLSKMKDPGSYNSGMKSFIRFVRNLFAHFRTNPYAINIIGSRECIGKWVLANFRKLFFDIYDHSSHHMDGFYCQILHR